jgi:hypothetical protein
MSKASSVVALLYLELYFVSAFPDCIINRIYIILHNLFTSHLLFCVCIVFMDTVSIATSLAVFGKI